MAVSNITAVFHYNIEKVWDTVTSLQNYSWRRDLSRVEIINEQEFIEYTKEGYTTHFTVTAIEPYKRWEFDMENDNIKGHWIGIFASKGKETEVNFTEDVTAKKIILKPFIKLYLKKQQRIYMNSLSKELGKTYE